MIRVTRRIMYGTEVIGYETDAETIGLSGLGFKYITKDGLVDIVNGRTANVMISNIKVVKTIDNEYIIRGANGTNLNEIDRINLNIPDIFIDNKQEIAQYVYIADKLKNVNEPFTIMYNEMVKFKNKIYDKECFSVLSNQLSAKSFDDMCVTISSGWLGATESGLTGNIIEITECRGIIKVHTRFELKSGEPREINFEIDGNQYKSELKSKLQELFNYLLNNTHHNLKESTEAFKLRHNGLDPQRLERVNKRRCEKYYNELVEIYLQLKNVPKLQKFIYDRRATFIPLESYNCGSAGEFERRMAYGFEWRVRGYNKAFKIMFYRHDFFKEDKVEKVRIWIEYNENADVTRYAYNYEYNDNYTEHTTFDIPLKTLHDNDIVTIKEAYEKALISMIDRADAIKDKNIASAVGGWFSRK